MNSRNTQDTLDQLRETLRQRMIDGCVPSIALSVAQQGRVLWEEGFGWANRERRLVSSEHIAYPLASVTKPLTATAIMRLVEMGKLDLDKPVNHYLDEHNRLKIWIGDPDELTVRRLANHTGGLTTFVNLYPPGDRVGLPTQAESIRRYGHAVAEPGERYRYSNFGYGILDFLVAQISGMSFSDFMHQEVFVPLGMHRSAIGVPARLADFAATRYDDEQQPIPDPRTDHAGASSAYASAHDLLRFGLFHLKQPLPDQKRILTDASIDEMHKPTAQMGTVPATDLNLRPQSHYGVGWVIDPNVIPRRISHGGGMGGSASKLLLLPDEGIVVAIVSNIFKPLAYQFEDDLLEALLPHYTRRESSKPSQSNATADASTLSPLLGDWVGQIHTYERPMTMTLHFRECGHVYATVGQYQQTTLVNGVQFEDGWLKGTLAGMIETTDANRTPRHPYHHLQLDLRLRGDRLTGAVISVAGHNLNHWVDLRRRAHTQDNHDGRSDT